MNVGPWVAGIRKYISSQTVYPFVAFGMAFGVSLSIYILTIAPDITWQYHGADGAELVAASVTLGVPHPPGYPLYVLLGNLFSKIPSGPLPYRYNLFSAICMALSAGILSLLAFRLATGKHHSPEMGLSHVSQRHSCSRALILGLATGLGFAFLPLVWKQAIIAEVYATNTVLVSLVLWRLFREEGAEAPLRTGLFLGLSITSHLTSLLLLPICLLVVRRRQWPRLMVGLAIGLTPFLALPWFGAGRSPVTWGDPTTLPGWWWLVSAEIYRPNVFGLPLPSYSARLLDWSVKPTFVIGTVLFLWAVWRRRSVSRRHRKLFAGLTGTVVLYMLYAFTYDAPDALVYTMPALAMVVTLAASTIERPSPLHLLLPVTLIIAFSGRVDLSKTTSARAVVESSLLSAPENAILLTSGDRATFSVWYLQHVEGKRSDLLVVDGDLLAFEWYRSRLAQTHPLLSGLETDDIVKFRELNDDARPWCELSIDVHNNKETYCAGEIP